MTMRAKCPQCGKRVALTKKGTVKGHGQGWIPREGAGGMVCPGTGKSAALTAEPVATEGEGRVMIWHDEADRLAVWGSLDPPDACMCRDCVLATSGDEDDAT